MEKIKQFIEEKPKQALAVFAVVIIGGAILLGVLTSGNNAQTADDSDQNDSDVTETDTRTATVFALQDTTVTLRSGTEGRLSQVADYQTTGAQSVVSTSSSSYGLIMLEDGSVVALAPDTQVTIYPDPESGFLADSGDLWYRPVDDTALRTAFALLKGDSSSASLNDISDSSFSLFVQNGTITAEVFDDDTSIALTDLDTMQTLELSRSRFNDYEGGALSEYIQPKNESELEEDTWYQFTTCLDAYLASILADDPDADTVEEGLKTCSSIIVTPSDAGESAEVTIDEVNAVFNSPDTLTCSWETTAADIQGYAYWIGTSAGDDDVKAETFIEDTETSYTFTPVTGKKYYCSVRVITADGTGEKTSAAAEPQDVSGELTVTIPDDDRFDGELQGKVDSATAASEFEVHVMLESEDGMYLAPSGWQSDKYVFELPVANDYDFSGSLPVDDEYNKATLKLQLVYTDGPSIVDELTLEVKL